MGANFASWVAPPSDALKMDDVGVSDPTLDAIALSEALGSDIK